LEDQGNDKAGHPVPKSRLYYIVLKYVVIAAAVLIALYVASQLL
jgi:hypothetical protein